MTSATPTWAPMRATDDGVPLVRCPCGKVVEDTFDWRMVHSQRCPLGAAAELNRTRIGTKAPEKGPVRPDQATGGTA